MQGYPQNEQMCRVVKCQFATNIEAYLNHTKDILRKTMQSSTTLLAYG